MKEKNKHSLGFSIETEEGRLLGFSQVEWIVYSKKIFFENLVFFENEKKKAWVEYDQRGLSSVRQVQIRKIGEKSWKQESWLLRGPQPGWILYRSKLGKTWKEIFSKEPIQNVFGLGFLFSYFEIGFLSLPRKLNLSFFHLDHNFFGNFKFTQPFRREEFAELMFQFFPLSPYVSHGEESVRVTRRGGIPTEIRYLKNRVCVKLRTSHKVFMDRVRPSICSSIEFRERFLFPVGKETQHIFFSEDGTSLSGSLERPKSGNSLGCFLLLHGSGFETRDSGSGYEGRDVIRVPSQPFRELSRKLVREGFSVFRYDKRGVGKSKGIWARTGRKELEEDAIAGLRFVTGSLGEKKCFLLGFSEGGNLAISVGKETSQYLKGLILAGSPFHPLDQVILQKIPLRLKKMKVQRSKILLEKKRWEDFFDSLKKLPHLHKIMKQDLLVKRYSLKWWLEHFSFFPGKEIQKVKVPILLLHGEKDAEVLVQECKAMQKLLQRKKISFQVKIFSQLNHFFTYACPQNPGFEYDVPQEMDPRVVSTIVRWAKGKLTS